MSTFAVGKLDRLRVRKKRKKHDNVQSKYKTQIAGGR